MSKMPHSFVLKGKINFAGTILLFVYSPVNARAKYFQGLEEDTTYECFIAAASPKETLACALHDPPSFAKR